MNRVKTSVRIEEVNFFSYKISSFNKPFLLDELELSYWAYEYCKDTKDDPEIREVITHSWVSYVYCRDVKDNIETRKNIIYPDDANLYCRYVSKNYERLLKLEKERYGDI